MKYQTGSSGQVVLITLLVLTIATTVALSLISRTTTDTSITNQTEQSSRAFSAAEAGVEEALKSGSGTSGAQVLAPGVSYNVSVASIGGTAGLYGFPQKTLKGATETVWLIGHDPATGLIDEASETRFTGSSIDVCWSDGTPKPAIEVTLIYKSGTDGTYRTARGAFDPDNVRATTNHFTVVPNSGGCGGTTGTAYKATITFSLLNPPVDPDPSSDTLLMLRIHPYYSDTNIAIDPVSSVLPPQGNRIESTGTTTGANRKIVVTQPYRAPSTVFDAALYSQDAIQH